MSPARRKKAVPPRRKAIPRPARGARSAGNDLQALVDQIQALQRQRGGSRSSAQKMAELDRLRRLLLTALDVDDDGEPENGRDGGGSTSHSDEEDWYEDDSDEDDSDEDEYEVAISGQWEVRRDWTRFTPARPIRVDSGLVMRSRRGVIGETWWSRRFLAAVESTLAGGRLNRGRTYARQGQVMELEIGSGLISARVQGTRRTPYRVRVAMPAASDGKWEGIVDALAAQAGYAARLLAGELPHDIEDVFAGAGVSLFPASGTRLATDCTCPDWANPCKHVAATCYLVAEAFDNDPFLLLAFRGRERDALLAELRRRRGGSEGDPVSPAPEPAVAVPALTDCVIGFWKAGSELADVHCRPRASDVAGAVLRQLARGVIEVRGRDVTDLLEPAYASLAHGAEARAFGGNSKA
jgi:uncharacterized Zn finger protein